MIGRVNPLYVGGGLEWKKRTEQPVSSNGYILKTFIAHNSETAFYSTFSKIIELDCTISPPIIRSEIDLPTTLRQYVNVSVSKNGLRVILIYQNSPLFAVFDKINDKWVLRNNDMSILPYNPKTCSITDDGQYIVINSELYRWVADKWVQIQTGSNIYNMGDITSSGDCIVCVGTSWGGQAAFISYDLVDGVLISRPKPNSILGDVKCAKISGNGNVLVVGASSSNEVHTRVYVWKDSNWEILTDLENVMHSCAVCSVNYDGNVIAFGGYDEKKLGQLLTYIISGNTATLATIDDPILRTRTPVSCDLSHEGKMLIMTVGATEYSIFDYEVE